MPLIPPKKNQPWSVDLAAAREVMASEADAITRLAASLDEKTFGAAVDLLASCKSQVVVTGMGKSGHIAAKTAATFASTGTPSFYLHPGEALHGDLGMITHDNAVVAFSQSGATDEILNILPYLKTLHVPIVAITGMAKSILAQQADIVLLTSIEAEACPLNLAPTNSTTAQLALGDALAIALMKRRGFTADDFAMRHPLGALGRRLLVRVSDLMQVGDDNPIIDSREPLHRAINRMTRLRLGAVSIISSDGKLVGIFCDGDLRRLFERLEGKVDAQRPISEFMIPNPRRVTPDTLGVKCVDLMEQFKITVMPVVDTDSRPIGMIHLHDLIRAGISP
ncbi:KpsF/GutQ family sugar-phosphate isomerase [Candidatus Sumerlaeota bacterium]|nr:KpsF/GutQ family sugar-phosphate isomerase [Candidatus Sumerlaeota bacterium]